MTSNEIRAEFESWFKGRFGYSPSINGQQVHPTHLAAYLAAAEPREKRIAELEKDVADSASAISAIHQLRMNAEKRIAELVADRDEWRHKHESLRSDIATVEARIAENEKCLSELSGFAERDKQRIAELEQERDEARVFGEKAAKLYNELLADQPVLTCAFCGQAYPPDTPATQHQALADHIAVCAKHPMRELEARLARLREAAKAVQKIADRNTDEFNALRAALAEEQEKPCPPSQS
jgi:DNA repair exonuclease SbcCD ATPase subunit